MYIGCGVDSKTMKSLMTFVMNEQQIQREQTADGVEVVYRGNEENRIRVVMNHNGYEAVYGDRMLEPYESYIERV